MPESEDSLLAKFHLPLGSLVFFLSRCLTDLMKPTRIMQTVLLYSKSTDLSTDKLSDFTCTFHFHTLGKEMATHSSVHAWKIPGTGEPGGLPSMGSHSRIQLKQLSSSSSNLVSKIPSQKYPE